MAVESLAESEGEVTCVGGKDDCRFAEKKHVRATLENGRECAIRVSAGSGVKSENLSHCYICFQPNCLLRVRWRSLPGKVFYPTPETSLKHRWICQLVNWT